MTEETKCTKCGDASEDNCLADLKGPASQVAAQFVKYGVIFDRISASKISEKNEGQISTYLRTALVDPNIIDPATGEPKKISYNMPQDPKTRAGFFNEIQSQINLLKRAML